MFQYSIEPLASDEDLDGVLEVEAESFTNPWTRDMYAWELQNRAMCHILLVRTADRRVVGFCAFWLVFDEIHINNFALRPGLRRVSCVDGSQRRLLQFVYPGISLQTASEPRRRPEGLLLPLSQLAVARFMRWHAPKRFDEAGAANFAFEDVVDLLLEAGF